MTEKPKPVRDFASSREAKLETSAPPMTLNLSQESHAKARSSEEKTGGVL
jgi:hypothetical protein